MTIEAVSDVFLWATLLNIANYVVWSLFAIFSRDWLFPLLARIWGLAPEAVAPLVARLMWNYKLIVTVFFFAPCIALLIVRWSG